jgi:phage terminase large subunit
VHGEPRLIDYYEASGVGLEHYVAQLRAGHRAHWVYGQHFFPHDLKVKELGSGMSRVDVLRGFGLSPDVLPQVQPSMTGYQPRPGSSCANAGSTRSAAARA